MALFRKRKKAAKPVDPSARKATVVGKGKLEPFEYVILAILLFILYCLIFGPPLPGLFRNLII